MCEPCGRKQWVVSNGRLIIKARPPFRSWEKGAVAERMPTSTGLQDCWERVVGSEIPRCLGRGVSNGVTGSLAKVQTRL